MISTVRLLLVLLLALPTAALAGETPLPESWTARQAVAFALRNSPDSRIAVARVKEARALLSRAQAGFYPQVGLSAGYSQTDNPMYSFGNILNQGEFSPSIDFNNPGRTDDLNLSVGVRYRFYNGGQDRAHRQAARAGVEVSAAESRQVRQQLAFAVFRSFQAIVESENIHRARLAALKAIRSALGVAQARFEAGDLLKVDLLNLEVQESRALEGRIQAEHQLRLAQKVFLQLLGLDDREVRIDAAAQVLARPAVTGLEARPELRRMQAALRAAEAELTAARGSRLPTLDGFASYQHDEGTVLSGSGDSWMAGLKLDFKLFDGHLATSAIAASQARLERLRAEQHKLALALGLELTRAELNLSQAEQRREVTRKMVEQAAESESLSQAQFRAGVILSSDLIDSENRLTDARVGNALATSAVEVAVADLRRAAGLPLFAASDSQVPSEK